MTDVLTTVANFALVQMGHTTITSLDDGTDAAVKIKAVYDTSRRDVLENAWGFARKTVIIAADTTPPVDTQFSNRYALPNDFVFFQRLGYEQEGWRVEREGNYLLSNAGPPLKLVYTMDEKSLSRWPQKARTALSFHLAASTAKSITGQLRVQQEMQSLFEHALSMALHADSVQEPHGEFAAPTWENARHIG